MHLVVKRPDMRHHGGGGDLPEALAALPALFGLSLARRELQLELVAEMFIIIIMIINHHDHH